MSELKSPKAFQINQYIKNKTVLEFHTINNEILKGHIIWSDNSSFHLMLDSGKEATLHKSAIVYYIQVT